MVTFCPYWTKENKNSKFMLDYQYSQDIILFLQRTIEKSCILSKFFFHTEKPHHYHNNHLFWIGTTKHLFQINFRGIPRVDVPEMTWYHVPCITPITNIAQPNLPPHIWKQISLTWKLRTPANLGPKLSNSLSLSLKPKKKEALCSLSLLVSPFPLSLIQPSTQYKTV